MTAIAAWLTKAAYAAVKWLVGYAAKLSAWGALHPVAGAALGLTSQFIAAQVAPLSTLLSFAIGLTGTAVLSGAISALVFKAAIAKVTAPVYAAGDAIKKIVSYALDGEEPDYLNFVF